MKETIASSHSKDHQTQLLWQTILILIVRRMSIILGNFFSYNIMLQNILNLLEFLQQCLFEVNAIYIII